MPKDANDERNVFLEIRAGTGGDESALFAGNLFRMYSAMPNAGAGRSVVLANESELGGYREVIARIAGTGVLKLKFESGGHRTCSACRNRGAGTYTYLGVHRCRDA